MTSLPETLGPFSIVSVLGEGGSGIVYHARIDGRDVAVKVLRRELALTEREVARFMAEAERAQRVSHPSLVHVEGVGCLDDGRPYLVMPLLRGEGLATVLARGRIPQTMALSLFENVAEALVELHQAGLVHRDVKPENVFVTDGRAILLDLGIARDIGGADSTTTQAGMVRGTPAYMAPERFFGRPAGVTTDVYELATLLYAMLTGRLPWNGADDSAGRMNPMSPARAGVLVPDTLSAALMRALAFAPEARPASVRAFLLEVRSAIRVSARDLGEASTTLAAQVTPAAFGSPTPGPVVTQAQPKRRGSGALVFAAIAAALGLASLGGASVWVVRTRAESARAAAVAGASATELAVIASATAAPPSPSTTGAPPPSAAPPSSVTPPSSAAPPPSTSPPRPGPPKPSATPSATASAPPPPAVAGEPLPACEKLAAYYCGPEWKPVERGECAAWTKNAHDWRKYTGEARRTMNDSCASTLTQQPAVLAARLDSLKRGAAPPPR